MNHSNEYRINVFCTVRGSTPLRAGVSMVKSKQSVKVKTSKGALANAQRAADNATKALVENRVKKEAQEKRQIRTE